jgi:hypothetical protein
MRYDPPVARFAAAYRVRRHAREAIARGDDRTAAMLIRSSTQILFGERPAEPAPVDLETLKRREIDKAHAATVLVGFGQTRH